MATSRLGLAAVLLNESRLRSAKAYIDAIQQWLPDQTLSKLESTEVLRVLQVGSSEVYLALMGPYPWQNLVTLTETSWHWKDSRELLRLHNAHIHITLRLGPADPLERAMLLSKITAALLSCQDCIGVYWDGPAISPAEMFLSNVKQACEGGSFPLLSWISFGIAEQNAGIAIITQGLEELGHKELEIISHAADATAFNYTLDLCNQLLKKGPFLKHGEAVGRNSAEYFPIIHRPATWDPAREVIEIDMRKCARKIKRFFVKLFGSRSSSENHGSTVQSADLSATEAK
jgi:hypothetical protein